MRRGTTCPFRWSLYLLTAKAGSNPERQGRGAGDQHMSKNSGSSPGRGGGGRGGGGGGRGGSSPDRSPNDDRSDALNPNSDAYAADQANREDQDEDDD